MKTSAVLLALAPAIAVALFALDASATKLRRPFVADKSFNYGYDNNGSSSGCSDYNCGDRCYDGHTGNDYALSIGTDVLAPADGVVVATFDGCPNYGGLGSTCGTGCGNYVKLQLPDGNFVLFCHFELGSLQVSNGQLERPAPTPRMAQLGQHQQKPLRGLLLVDHHERVGRSGILLGRNQRAVRVRGRNRNVQWPRRRLRRAG